MANSFHSGFFEEMKRSNRALIAVGKTMLKGGSPLEPKSLTMPAKQNLKYNRMQNEDLRRVQSNPAQRFRRMYRRGI